MKTDALIAMLARGPIAASRHAVPRRLAVAVAVGTALAIAALLGWLGPRPDLPGALGLPMFWLKFSVPLVLALAAFAGLTRLARPGDSAPIARHVAVTLVVLLWLAAAADLASSAAGTRAFMLLGNTALPCVVSIALLSLPLLIATFAAVRSLAPTRLAAAGAAAGALSGSAAAAVYAWTCTEATLPFLAVWYLLGIAVPTAFGR